LQARFAGRIVPIDAAIVDRWGLIAAEAKRKAKALSVIDGFTCGDRAASQSDCRLAQCHRLYECASSGTESVGGMNSAVIAPRCTQSDSITLLESGANGEGRTPMALRPLEPKGT